MALIFQNLRHVGAVVGGCNLVGFAVTAVCETHKITDLVGVGAFVAAAISLQSKVTGEGLGSRSGNLRLTLLTSAIILWGSRLSSFLFYRVLQLGEDKRLKSFFRAKDEPYLDLSRSFFPVHLASFWAIQALWAWTSLLPLSFLSAVPAKRLGPAAILSLSSLALGIGIESVADWQKYSFKQRERERERGRRREMVRRRAMGIISSSKLLRRNAHLVVCLGSSCSCSHLATAPHLPHLSLFRHISSAVCEWCTTAREESE
mmetsp:Transcript_40526/g.41357  ORF Transcript_40526/g.41357 Transcript_40526/m.41357 type:complete len:260 (+) Transcript_40526:98-877(+)